MRNNDSVFVAQEKTLPMCSMLEHVLFFLLVACGEKFYTIFHRNVLHNYSSCEEKRS